MGNTAILITLYFHQRKTTAKTAAAKVVTCCRNAGATDFITVPGANIKTNVSKTAIAAIRADV